MKVKTAKGFSLLELTIATGISLIALTAVTSLLVNAYKVSAEAELKRQALVNKSSLNVLFLKTEYCTANLKDYPFNRADPRLTNPGIPIVLSEVKDGVKQPDAFLKANSEYGGAAISNIYLKLVKELDPTHFAAEIEVNYKGNIHNKELRTIPITIVTEGYSGSAKIQKCFGGSAVDFSGNSTLANEYCKLMANIENQNAAGWQYDPVTQTCHHSSVSDCFDQGDPTKASCTPNYPYFNGKCTAGFNYKDCPPDKCVRLKDKNGKDLGFDAKYGKCNGATFDAEKQVDVATCSWAAGFTGTCTVCCRRTK